MQTSKLKSLGAAAALTTASLLGSIGGTPQIGEGKERSVQIGGVGAKKKRKQSPHKFGGHRRTYVTGKPWIPSLDLRHSTNLIG